MGQYNFAQLYGMADHSMQLYDKGDYDGVVENSTWGRTNDGSKGQWELKIRFSNHPQDGGKAIKTTMTVSPENDKGLGIMFRQLDALAVPYQTLATEEQMAQAMNGKPILFSVGHHV